MFKVLSVYLILLIGVLLSVAFVTLLEQKILAGTQIRVGPNFTGYWGLFQPFADAVKLFNKEFVVLRASMSGVYFFSPVASLGLSLVLWLSIPLLGGGYDFVFGFLFFMSVSGVAVYPILSSGWSSNCKYSMLGSLRAVAQMISYEISLAMILLSLIWLMNSFNLSGVLASGHGMWNLLFVLPLGLIWFASSLAETNRTPYDFAEGESELVSGFNTEYSAGGFTMIFMAEYASILFMSALFVVLFLSSAMGAGFFVKTMVISCLFIWVRGTMPRYRYDKLMNLAWKSFLPVSLNFLLFYMMVGSVLF
nr:NADH dehydrogenase subunit 1 [Eusirus cf. giganteus clade g2]